MLLGEKIETMEESSQTTYYVKAMTLRIHHNNHTYNYICMISPGELRT
jgi:protein associated with RNAse G/E